YADANDKFIAQNPEFYSDDYRAQSDDFRNKTVGARNLYSIKMPYNFDPSAFATVASAAAKFRKQQDIERGDFIAGTDETTYDNQIYDEAFMAALTQTKNGRSALNNARNIYATLPPERKEGLSFEQW